MVWNKKEGKNINIRKPRKEVLGDIMSQNSGLNIVSPAALTMPSNLQQPNGDHLFTNGDAIGGTTKGYKAILQGDDGFQHLSKPQQDVLLLHGPRQKYSLETTEIPDLTSDREILVQVCEHVT